MVRPRAGARALRFMAHEKDSPGGSAASNGGAVVRGDRSRAYPDESADLARSVHSDRIDNDHSTDVDRMDADGAAGSARAAARTRAFERAQRTAPPTAEDGAQTFSRDATRT